MQFGFGCQQIGQAFGFGQIDPAMKESAPGEFARFGAAQAGQGRQRRFDRADHRAAAVEVQFGAILAGRGGGGGEPQHQRAIEHLAGGIAQLGGDRAARRGQTARQLAQGSGRSGPADAQHGNSRWGHTAGQGEDRIGHRPVNGRPGSGPVQLPFLPSTLLSMNCENSFIPNSPIGANCLVIAWS